MGTEDLETLATNLAANNPDLDIDELGELVRQNQPLAPAWSVATAVLKARQRQTPMGLLAPLLGDRCVGEIMINGPGKVWVDDSDGLNQTEVKLQADEITVLIEHMLDPLGLRVDRSSPFADGRLKDGSRIHIVVPPLAPDGPVITIRRFAESPLPLSAFGPPELVEILIELVESKATVLVVGGTGTGKTSLLGSLIQHMSPSERLVVIEDTAELRWENKHIVRMEARPANSEGVGEVTLRTLIRNALRMRPDRLVLGEVRGPEALDLILALNTGHRGSMATCHANSPLEAVLRLETLAAMGAGDTPTSVIRQQLLSGIDSIVYLERSGPQRKVAAVIDVVKHVDHTLNQQHDFQDRWKQP